MRRLKVFESLKEPAFRFYISSILCDSGAMSMRQISQTLLLYRLTGSAALLGVMALAHSLPLFVLSPIAGAIADRFQKKNIVLVGITLSTMITLGIAFCLTSGYLSVENAGSWWVLLVASTLEGIVISFVGPARYAMIPDLVSHERVTNAVALSQMGQSVARIMTPALAGFLIEAFSFEVAYYTRATLYFSAVLLWLIVPPVSKLIAERGNILSDIKGVLLYLRRETIIATILGFVLLVVFCSMPYQSLLPIFTDDILKVGASGLGVLQSVSGVGAITGALVLASLPNKRRGAILIATATTLGLALTGFSFSSSWYLSLVIVFIIGTVQTGRMTLPMALIQNYTKAEYRGRVISFYGMEMGVSSFGAFFAGIMASFIGVQWAVGGLALILVILSLLVSVFMPRLRKLD